MSYTPLPEIFLEDLKRSGPGAGVELGCGEGRFTRLLTAAGARPVCLDRRAAWAGTIADVVADARSLPLREASVSLLVAAGLLRHLWPLPGGLACPTDWIRCLAPGGALWIFEDEPLSHPPAARHFRDAMAFLARVAPDVRRPLLPLATFRRRWRANAPGQWRHGCAMNEFAPDDVEVLASLLEGEHGSTDSPGARLAAAIRRDGLSYGHYWWARLERPREDQA